MADKMELAEFIGKYGPLTPISNEESWQLYREGQWDTMFAVVGTDVPYDELPEDDRPTKDELEMMECDSPDDYSLFVMEGIAGHHVVNVERRYRLAKPMPVGLRVEIDDFGLLPDA